MKRLEELQKLYSEGRMRELEKAIHLIPESRRTIEEKKLLVWTLYSFKQYRKAFDIAVEINDEELISQIIIHVIKDGDRLVKALEMFPNSPSVWNAYVIRARDHDFNSFSFRAFFEKDQEFANSKEIGAINYRNNLARLLLAKGRSRKDIFVAIGLWSNVLPRYGSENYHHRAAVCFWMLQAYKKLGEMSSAKELAIQSAELWELQRNRDPENPGFIEKHENALKILSEF